MANTDKNIVITPNNGSASDPNIVFSGANATTGAQNITLTVTPNNSGTVAFSGSAGQLLAINNDISNTLSTGGTISATGNITANNFVGNLVGNITGNFSGSLANGNSNISIPVANGNVNISAVGNANIVVVTGTGANVVGTLSVSGDANVGNIGATNGVFTNVSGNGSSLSSITGGNVTGQVGNALTAGTVYTNAQPNITSVGTLTSLSVSGNANVGNIGATNGVFTNVSGNGSTLTSITGASVTGQVGNALVAGTVYTAAQPNITSVGTLTGLTLSGNVNMGTNYITTLADPVSAQDAATKAYVDSVAQGLDPKASVVYATTTTIFGSGYTYDNGTSGVGATITSSSNGAISIDGSTPTAGDRVLIKNEAGAFVNNTTQSAAFNGIYIVTQVGSGALPFILTRATDFDNGSPSGEIPGAFTFVEAGTTNADTGWVCTTNSPVTMGTTQIVFTQFSGAGTYSAGTGLTLTGTVFSVNESQTQVTAVGTLTTLSVSGNANVGNIGAANGVFTNVSGNGSSLTDITGANVTGQVANALVSGTVYTNAQPNITSVGTLTSLSVSGNITANNFVGNLVGNVTGNFSGSLANGNSNVNIPAANGNVNISSVGNANVVVVTGTGANVNGTLSVSGNANVGNIGATNGVFTNVSGNGSSLTSITGGNVTGQVANALVSGTVYTAAQPNITSVGTLSSLSVSGTATLAAVNGTDASFSGNATVNGNLFVNGNLTYLNVETVAVEDPIIQLQTGANGAAPIANSGKDVGTALNYYDTAAKIAFMGWDVSNAEIAFGSNVSITNEVVTFTSLANTRSGNTLTTGVFATTLSATGNANVGNIGATNGVFTNVSGNGSALTSLNASNLSSGTVSSSVLNITTSTTDTTAGKIMRTADWGFGTTAFAITDFTSNNLNYSQIFRALANATGGPGAGISGVALPYDGTPTTSYMAVTPGTTVGTVRAWAGTKTNSNGTPVWAELARLTAPTFTNYIGIGAINQNYIISVSGSQTGNTVTGGINISATVQNDVTSTAYGVLANPTTAANVFTLANFRGFQAGISLGAGSTVTNAFGFTASSLLGTNATNGYGFSSDLAAAANKWNFYAGGTANNYMAGSLGIGSTNLSAINLRLSKSITGGTTAINFLSDGTISSDVTGTAVLNRTSGITAAATFTLTNLIYNQAVQGTFGLNSTVTTQSGFTADNTLTGATNNYGFRGSIASGANRFNLYMDGSANNYSAGNFGIGTTSPAVALHVKQNAGSINVEGTDQAYIQFYPRTVANIRTAYIGVGSAGSNNFTIRNDDNGRLLLESGNSNVSVFANGNVTTTVAGVANVVVVTSTGANIAGTLSATGNITGNFFIGNGSQLTGITTATSLANGNSNIAIPAANGNINFSIGGSASEVVFTSTGANVNGYLSVSGNANIANIGTAGLITATGNITGGNLSGTLVTGTLTTAAQPNITSVGTLTSLSVSGNANIGNIGTAGLITATGNITGGNLIGRLANGNSNVNIPAANGNINFSSAGNANILIVTGTGANLTGTLNISGDTTFSGVGQRILGDFSNATLSSRTAFQDKTTNGVTGVNILPNGTATESALTVFNNSNAANSSYGSINGNATLVRIISAATGSGTALPLTFSTGAGGTEAARIDTSQNFLIGRTSLSNNISNVKGVSIVNDGRIITEQDYNTAGIPTAGLFTQNIFNSSGNVTNMVFYRNGTSVGTIVTTASATAYNTSSDYRLKSNTQPLTGSGAFIDALKPKTWTWIINGEPGIGFIAHEVAEVAPSTVFGEKDAVNEDGTPNHQAMEYGSAEFIAHIIAELQDLRRRFAELQTEVNNLKNP